MKKLVLLLSALLVLSTFTYSPVQASPSSLFEQRVQSFLALVYQNVFPFSGVVIVPEEVFVTIGDDGRGPRTGGDADDLANGKGEVVLDSKPNASSCLGDSGTRTGTDLKGK